MEIGAARMARRPDARAWRPRCRRAPRGALHRL